MWTFPKMLCLTLVLIPVTRLLPTYMLPACRRGCSIQLAGPLLCSLEENILVLPAPQVRVRLEVWAQKIPIPSFPKLTAPACFSVGVFLLQEQNFSSAGCTLTPKQSRLDLPDLEQFEVIRSAVKYFLISCQNGRKTFRFGGFAEKWNVFALYVYLCILIILYYILYYVLYYYFYIRIYFVGLFVLTRAVKAGRGKTGRGGLDLPKGLQAYYRAGKKICFLHCLFFSSTEKKHFFPREKNL